MPDDDGVVADQDLLDNETHDPLALLDIEGLGGGAQPGEEAGQGFREAEIDGAVVHLIQDCLQLRLRGVLALAQVRHSPAEFVERQQIFLIGGQEAIRALADPGQIALQGLLAQPGRVGRPGCRQPAIELVPDQAGVFQQTDDLGPHHLIDEILANRTVVAHRAAQMPPGVGA